MNSFIGHGVKSEMPNWFSHRIHQSNWREEAVKIHPGPIVSLSRLSYIAAEIDIKFI